MKKRENSDSDKKIVYVMTVGTGGRTSNLAQGIVNAINLRKKDLKEVFLMPSFSEDSKTIAELVCQECSAVGVRISILGHFTDPDALLVCRREFREVLSRFRKERVAVNPTSGTKQMTAGATLAALDLGFGVIEFIVGERQDGIVVTGTEKIESVDAARLQAEQSVKNILVLLENGDYSAAALLAGAIDSFFPTTAGLCRMLSAWNRMNYSEASRAAPSSAGFEQTRKVMGRLNSSPKYSLDRIADLLVLAARDLEYSRVEESLSALYRAVELMAKFHMVELECPPEEWFAENICKKLDLSSKLQKSLFAKQKESGDKPLRLGLKETLEILSNTRFTLCKLLPGPGNWRHWETLMMRNETRFGHGDKSVKPEDVSRLKDAVYGHAVTEWAELDDLMKQSQFPDVENAILKEINNESE